MKEIFLTGHSGFVGINLLSYLKKLYNFKLYNRNSEVVINEQVVIHLAGKAHDLKNGSNSNEYYEVNTDLTKKIFDSFLVSNANVFITLSSVKAVADEVDIVLTEEHIPCPITDYGKSKLLAENYILSKLIPKGKRVYILRPCMIHGPKNKGNLNLLYELVNKGLPWPLGKYNNKRSFCSIENLCFVISEFIENEQIQSGVYNIADDEPISTNELIELISMSQCKQPFIWKIPKFSIYLFSKVGDLLRLPLNTERLNKLTETYIVSNNKIKRAINKPLPISAKNGLIKTLNSFNKFDV